MIFSHSWLKGLFGEADVAALLSADQTLSNMLAIEAAYTDALRVTGVVSETAARAVLNLLTAPNLDIDGLMRGTSTDGLVVPTMIKQLKAQLPEDSHVALHQGLTSQDVIDTAFSLGLRPIFEVLVARLDGLDALLGDMSERFAENSMMARTRMQAAFPISVQDRIELWKLPLKGHRDRLDRLRPGLLILSLGGPIGTRPSDLIASHVAESLDLGLPGKAPHAMRENMGELANWLSLVTGTLGKMGQDISLMSQQGVDEIKLRGGGSSSAMAHKSNPIKAELLVTLARFNATLLGGVHQALVHEQERSGAAWALEWMLLPQMLESTGTALRTAIELVGDITEIGTP